MRIAICTLSAVLLSGCSWLGMGSGSSANGCATGHSQYGGAWNQGAAGCGGGYGGAYGQAAGYGANGYGAGQGGGWGYGAGANGAGGYGAAGYGANGAAGYGANGATGYGAAGFSQGGAGYGAAGYGQGFDGMTGSAPGIGAYGPGAGYSGANAAGFGQGNIGYGGQVTTLGAGAGYGTAVGGVAGGQYAQYATGGQVVGGNARQIQGAPIYVPRPYPAYYQAPRLRVGGAAQPLGLAGFAGVSTYAAGELFEGEAAKPASATRDVSALNAIEYADAFDSGSVLGSSLEYDVSRNTTVFAGASYAQYEGQKIINGTITDNMGTVATGDDVTEAGEYEFSDLNELTVEGGVRQYVGGNYGFRPYVSASGGFVHNNEVDLTTTSTGGTVVTSPEKQVYIREGWSPTAAGMIGAEIAAGPNAAFGVETGVRWTDDKGTNITSEDTWSVPVQVRGRIAF